ncbi:MAG: hypothetical protein F6J90_10795 [Moorea sp. SIOASIH]|nr:hypothetical protein [Moorena sp. SIOASIH]
MKREWKFPHQLLPTPPTLPAPTPHTSHPPHLCLSFPVPCSLFPVPCS